MRWNVKGILAILVLSLFTLSAVLTTYADDFKTNGTLLGGVQGEKSFQGTPDPNAQLSFRHKIPFKNHPRKPVPFVPNSFRFWDNPVFWPTKFGPAYADIVKKPENFLQCNGGPIALCYYSGPEPETCTLTEDGRFATCQCFEIPSGPYFVDIHAILNYGVYLKTVNTCGKQGQKCLGEVNKAPVCQAINEGKLLPGADLISAFSFALVPEKGLGQTNCPADPNETAVYAGCMTASCSRTDEVGIVNCTCPTFNGRFQVGQDIPEAMCTLGSDLVWSAAYSPKADGKTFPTDASGDCFPEAAGEPVCQ